MPKRKKYGSYTWTDRKTGYLYARVIVARPDGTSKTVYRRAINKTHARQLADEIKDEYKSRGEAYLDAKTMTVADLAEWYKDRFVIAPVYVQGKKIRGMRTWVAERQKIDRICEILGKHKVNDVDEDMLDDYKVSRLRKGSSFATVNRDLESIRAMFRKAVKKKWRKEAIDFEGLIEKSMEVRRTVTITTEDEKRLLDAADDFARSPRLYALILALRDSGARPNELYPVNDYTSDYGTGDTFYEPIRWRDVFTDGVINDLTVFVSYKGKVREERIGVITERVKVALLNLWNRLQGSKVIRSRSAQLDNLIFPHTSYQGAWDVVRKKAGMPDLRLRDLRRDWVTRLAKGGFSDKLAQHGAGHKTMQMSYEDTVFDKEAALQAKAAIDAANCPIEFNKVSGV